MCCIIHPAHMCEIVHKSDSTADSTAVCKSHWTVAIETKNIEFWLATEMVHTLYGIQIQTNTNKCTQPHTQRAIQLLIVFSAGIGDDGW